MRRHIRALQLLGMLTFGMVVLMACSFGADGTSYVGGSSSTTPAASGSTPAAAPTATPLPPAPTCSAALPGAGAPSGGTSFTDLPYPTGSVATGLTLHHSGTGQWTISLQQVCASGTSVSAVRSFYSTQLPGHGWATSATLPFDGGLQAPCGDPYCWSKDAAPRYVGLESVTDRGSGVITFQLRLFVPPTAPNCSASDPYGIYSGKTYESSWTEAGVPLPPLTIFGIGDGFTMPPYSHDAYVSMCSAGTSTSVTNFFTTELPAQGWTHGALPASFSVCGGSSPAWYKGHIAFDMVTTGPIASGISWQMSVCITH